MPLQIVNGNILEQPAEVLVLPCNGSGIMGFVSLAGEVRRLAGREIYLAYRAQCPMAIGDVTLIDAGSSMSQSRILLACTMILPGTPIPLENVTVTTRAILEKAHKHGIQSLLWPLLGAGGGRVRPEHSFMAMHDEIAAYKSETDYDPHIQVVERDPHKFQELASMFEQIQSA